MVRHQVYFWLKSPESLDRLVAGLRTLAAIDLIREFHIGVPARTGKRDVVNNSFDVSELIMFDSAADQDAYQAHPLHRQFVADCEHLWERVVVYDSVDL